MMIESFFLCKKDFKQKYSAFPLYHLKDKIESFDIDFASDRTNNINEIKLDIITTRELPVNIAYQLDIIFDEDETLQTVADHFPHFSYKSFCPSIIHILYK